MQSICFGRWIGIQTLHKIFVKITGVVDLIEVVFGLDFFDGWHGSIEDDICSCVWRRNERAQRIAMDNVGDNSSRKIDTTDVVEVSELAPFHRLVRVIPINFSTTCDADQTRVDSKVLGN